MSSKLARMETLGAIRYIARYPVKSMRGEDLESSALGFQGIPHDRTYAFVQEGVFTSFPWLTGRQFPGLMQYQPAWENAEPGPRLFVTDHEGNRHAIDSPELREAIERGAGRPVRLHVDHRGNHDVAYVSLITTATVAALAAAGGVEADHHRFRMNVVIESDAPSFSENGWVGKLLRIGDCRLAVTELDRRCVMTTLDPATGESASAVLQGIARLNGACAGAYATVVAAGRIAVGDAVALDPTGD